MFVPAAWPAALVCRPAASSSSSEVDLDTQVEMFMKRQAEIESGGERPSAQPSMMSDAFRAPLLFSLHCHWTGAGISVS